MADVFISYSKQDREFASRLADAFAALGGSVWWDRDIRQGKYFDRIIEEELQKATVVIVIWSIAGCESNWCRAEAATALEADKLLPISIQQAKPPLQFRHVLTGDMSNWSGDLAAESFQRLCRDLRLYGVPLRPAPTSELPLPSPEPPAQPELPVQAKLSVQTPSHGPDLNPRFFSSSNLFFFGSVGIGFLLIWLLFMRGP
jgi:hypothetical protein